MQRSLVMGLALFCYGAFFVAFAYLVGFLAALPILPTHVDKGMTATPAVAAAIDLALIALFGLQHSVMARPGFKAAWTKIVPAASERSLYCLGSALALMALYTFWHPIPAPVWQIESPPLRTAIWCLFLLGFGIVFISTWLISHFELFGLAQAWANFRQRTLSSQHFCTPLFYRVVRHPIYLGFLIAFWATPDMTAGHLLLAAGITVYLIIGIHYEERDLTAHFGEDYRSYAREVGMLVPGVGKKSA